MKKILLELGKCLTFTILGPNRYDLLRFHLAHKRNPNLTNPRTFNEKLVWRKLYDTNPRFPILADKVLVREFVKKQYGDELLSKVYFVGDDVQKINFEALPHQFVIKATHGSGPDFIQFVYDKSQLSPDQMRQIFKKLLQRNFGFETNEWWYTKIKRAVMIEEFLIDTLRGIPLDYKFFVFHGKAKYIQVDYARFEDHKRTMYDIDWQPAGFSYKYQQGPITPRPKHLEKMIEIAEQIGREFDFVRVDLYCINDERIVFGEITLAPEAGWGQFSPSHWDYDLGSLW